MRGMPVMLSLICMASVGCGPGLTSEQQAEAHRKAKERVLAFFTTAEKHGTGCYWTENPRDLFRDCKECFRKGDLEADLAPILATGAKWHSGSATVFGWQIEVPRDPKSPDLTTYVMEVYMDGDPPRIVRLDGAHSGD